MRFLTIAVALAGMSASMAQAVPSGGAGDALCQASEAPHVRTYFYAGGEYRDDGKGGHYFSGQMYVEKLVPIHGVKRAFPIVLFHGNSMTGTVSFFFVCMLVHCDLGGPKPYDVDSIL